MAGFARWCFSHRKTVLAVWLIALVAFIAIGRSAGSNYTKSFSLPGTDSNRAQTVLQADFPAQAGDSEQIVVRAKRGTLRAPAAEAAVTAMLARVSQLRHVRSVVSPYRSASQISAAGTIGFATVTLDASTPDVPKSSVAALISTAQSADSRLLEVQLGGQAVGDDEQSSGSSSLLLGVVLALAVLFFAFRRSILGALLPLFSALGRGFAAAIFVDAFVIRTVLVPAVMHVLGRANWWLPGWLHRTLPRLNMEPSPPRPAPHSRHHRCPAALSTSRSRCGVTDLVGGRGSRARGGWSARRAGR